ncbi:hypothetical protein, partial [Streptomyces sp. KR55]|uniref:hypothetical protein n=1 Tax=Streptomyces sp. KR55 TaxID=3457425 RepID=UPI003FD03507
QAVDHALEGPTQRLPDRLRGPPDPEQQLTTQQPRSAVKLTHPVVAAYASLELQDVGDSVVELSAFDVAVANDRESVGVGSERIAAGLGLGFECVGYVA